MSVPNTLCRGAEAYRGPTMKGASRLSRGPMGSIGSFHAPPEASKAGLAARRCQEKIQSIRMTYPCCNTSWPWTLMERPMARVMYRLALRTESSSAHP